MNPQLVELAIAYAITAAAMLAGLLLIRADARAYWRWPVYSAMALALAVVSWNLLRKHLLPAEWVVTNPAALYYGALVLYALVGFALGLLLGRLTRQRSLAGRETLEDAHGEDQEEENKTHPGK